MSQGALRCLVGAVALLGILLVKISGIHGKAAVHMDGSQRWEKHPESLRGLLSKCVAAGEFDRVFADLTCVDLVCSSGWKTLPSGNRCVVPQRCSIRCINGEVCEQDHCQCPK